MRRIVPRATVLTIILSVAGALSTQKASKILEQYQNAGKVQTFATAPFIGKIAMAWASIRFA